MDGSSLDMAVLLFVCNVVACSWYKYCCCNEYSSVCTFLAPRFDLLVTANPPIPHSLRPSAPDDGAN